MYSVDDFLKAWEELQNINDQQPSEETMMTGALEMYGLNEDTLDLIQLTTRDHFKAVASHVIEEGAELADYLRTHLNEDEGHTEESLEAFLNEDGEVPLEERVTSVLSTTMLMGVAIGIQLTREKGLP